MIGKKIKQGPAEGIHQFQAQGLRSAGQKPEAQAVPLTRGFKDQEARSFPAGRFSGLIGLLREELRVFALPVGRGARGIPPGTAPRRPRPDWEKQRADYTTRSSRV